MLQLPKMRVPAGIRRSAAVQFRGLNHTQGARDGELWDMKNLSSRDYPVLSTRFRRKHYTTIPNSQGFGAWDGLYWVSAGQFYYGSTPDLVLPRGAVDPATQKTFGAMGAYIVILPDKKYYNILTGDFGDIEAEYTAAAGSFSYADGIYGGNPVVKNTLITTGAAFPFRVGDTISISGNTTIPVNNKAAITIEGISDDGKKLYFTVNAFYFPGTAATFPIAEALTLERSMPDIDFIAANGNRLWGVKDDTIYASALGDIFDWNSGSVLTADGHINEVGSWGAAVGSEGDFTAIFVYRGQVLCFKEEIVYQVYGDLPSNFAYQALSTLGVMKGSDKSLAVAGETLYYLSRVGVMAYRGSIPEPITSAFGNERFEWGVAGSDGLRYYISMADRDGNYRLYVYDSQMGLWHIEDEAQAMSFALYAENLYMQWDEGKVCLIGDVINPPDGVTEEEPFPFFAEFGDFVENEPNTKTMTKVLIRCELKAGSYVNVSVRYNTANDWILVRRLETDEYTVDATNKQSFYLPLIPHRADHMRLRFEGVGEFRLWSLTREYKIGSANRSYPN